MMRMSGTWDHVPRGWPGSRARCAALLVGLLLKPAIHRIGPSLSMRRVAVCAARRRASALQRRLSLRDLLSEDAVVACRHRSLIIVRRVRPRRTAIARGRPSTVSLRDHGAKLLHLFQHLLLHLPLHLHELLHLRIHLLLHGPLRHSQAGLQVLAPSGTRGPCARATTGPTRRAAQRIRLPLTVR